MSDVMLPSRALSFLRAVAAGGSVLVRIASLIALLLLLARSAGAFGAPPTCIAASTWAGPDYISPNWPIGVGVDSKGNVYISDGLMHEIVRIAPGQYNTAPFVGLAGVAGAKDGVGTSALLSSPWLMVFSPTDLLIVIDFSANSSVLRSVTPGGAVKTISNPQLPVGGSTQSGLRDGPIEQAIFGRFRSLALDAKHDVLYVGETGNLGSLSHGLAVGNIRIRAIFNILSDKNIMVKTLNVPTLPLNLGGMDYDFRRKTLYFAGSFLRDINSNIFSIDLSNVAWLENTSSLLSAVNFAGCSTSNIATNTDYGTSACFSTILDVKISMAGNLLYVSDSGTSRIRSIDLDDDFRTDVFVGTGNSGSGIIVGCQGSAAIPEPSWLAIDHSRGGDLIINLHYSAAVLRVTAKGAVSFVSKPEDEARDGTGLAARFGEISGMAFDAFDNLYVTDESGHLLRKISPLGEVSTINHLGGGIEGSASNAVTDAASAQFSTPTGVTVNTRTGVVYISDTGNHQLREYDPKQGSIKRFAGAIDGSGTTDGAALDGARFKRPGQLAFYHDSLGTDTVYVLDSLNPDYFRAWYYPSNSTLNQVGDKVRRVRNGVVDTIADMTIDDGQKTFSFFKAHSCITVDAAGVLYFSDFYNERIVRWTEKDNATLLFRFDGLAKDPTFISASPIFPGGLIFDPGDQASSLFNSPSLLIASPVWKLPLMRISVPVSPSNLSVKLWIPNFRDVGSLDGIVAESGDDMFDGYFAHLSPNLFALDSAGLLFVAHTLHGKIMRLGKLSGPSCNVSSTMSSTHPCRPGTFIDWANASCAACDASDSSDRFPFSSFCEDANGNFFANAGPSRPTPITAAESGLATAVGIVGAGFVIAIVAILVLRRRRALDALKRRPSSGEAVDVLVSTINLARRERVRSGLLLQVVHAAKESSAAGASGGGGGVSTLSFSDLVPDPHVAPLFGGFGVVFVARWVSRGLRVAVKVPKDLVVSGYLPPAAAAELVKEAQGLVRASDNLANEFVVRLFGVAQGDGGAAWAAANERARVLHFAKRAGSSEDPAVGTVSGPGDAMAADSSGAPMGAFHLLGLVMAFEEGGTLAEALQPPPGSLRAAWPLAMADRLRVARELVQGLSHLHRVGIVHGDLKLENVLLSGGNERHVRLADFGLSDLRNVADAAVLAQSRVSTAVQTDKKRGTWPYMAPEMFALGEGADSVRALASSRSTDVYALGTLLWEVMTGCEPWASVRGSADPAAARLALVRGGRTLDLTRLPADAPLALARLIADCTALDREARPRMGRVRAVIEQAHDEFLGGRFDVFLSHCWGSADSRKPLTDAIYFALKEHGLRVWLDSNEMGHDLVVSMADGISRSDCVLALISPDYERSRQCMFELRFACGSSNTGANGGTMEASSGTTLTSRLVVARSAAAAAEEAVTHAEVAAARALANAAAKVEARRRHLAQMQLTGDAEIIDSTEALLRAALEGEEGARAKGIHAVGMARAAKAAAAAAALAADGDVVHEASARATLTALAAPTGGSASRRPLVACVVEPGIWKIEGWTPGDELKALAGLSSKFYADASGASGVDFAAEIVPEAERRKLTHDPKALPRILELVANARKGATGSGICGGGGGGGGGGNSQTTLTPPGTTSSTYSSK